MLKETEFKKLFMEMILWVFLSWCVADFLIFMLAGEVIALGEANKVERTIKKAKSGYSGKYYPPACKIRLRALPLGGFRDVSSTTNHPKYPKYCH